MHSSSSPLQSYLVGPDVQKLNEQALKNLVDDVTFIEKEVKRLEKPGLDDVFDEIKSVSPSFPPPGATLIFVPDR